MNGKKNAGARSKPLFARLCTLAFGYYYYDTKHIYRIRRTLTTSIVTQTDVSTLETITTLASA